MAAVRFLMRPRLSIRIVPFTQDRPSTLVRAVATSAKILPVIAKEPVFLVPSRYGAWAATYAPMAARLQGLVPDAHIEHIGSTAVPGLAAKYVVDLMVGIESHSAEVRGPATLRVRIRP